MSLFTTQGYRYQLVAGNNVILDTFKDETIKISNNITELFDIGSVPGTFTRTISLPGTKKNNAFFEEYYDISVYSPDTFNANQKVPAYVDFGAVFLVNGYLQLMKINVLENKFVDSYEVNVFGAISNFSINANKLFLTDLTTLTQYNHTSSIANIQSSWDRNLFSGSIVYPMADYGKRLQFSDIDYLGIDDSEDALTVSDYKPAIRVEAVWDAVFDELGFTYTGSFFNKDWMRNTYMILNNNKRYPEYDYADLEVFYQGKVSTSTGSYSNLLIPSASFGQGTNLPMDSIAEDTYNAFTVGNPFFYEAPISSSRYQVDINLSYKVVNTNNTGVTSSQFPQFFLDIVRQSDNSVVNTSYLPLINDYAESAVIGRTNTVTEPFVAVQSFNLPYLQNPGNYSFKLGYTPFAYFGSTVAQPSFKIFDVYLNPTGSNSRSSFAVTQVRQAADFQVLDIAKNMPFGTSGIKLIDFIRSVQKKFNLIIYESKTVPNQMIVETFDDWYLQGEVQDFNKYINLDQKLEFIPTNTLSVNKVSFTDKDDADYVSKVFKQVNNRTYGQAFFIDTGSYFSQGEFKVETSVASGPIFQIPNTFVSGSSLSGLICNSYSIYNRAPSQVEVRFEDCVSGTPTIYYLNPSSGVTICSRTYPTGGGRVTPLGDCSPPVTGSAATSSVAPIGIPLFIGDQNYRPTQVFPRMMFYNGMVSSSRYYVEGQSSKNGAPTSTGLTSYPYFDNYNVVSGSYPTSESLSLLFNNETSLFGTTPQNSLINNYWSTYLGLLYSPRTRLVNATAVIPLAEYFNIELNDLVQFRGNYYHLRAINNYDLTTGECMIQLLGPVITDAVAVQLFGTPKKKTIINFGDFGCDFNNDFDNGTIICSDCCAPTMNSIGISGSFVTVDFTLATGSLCVPCQQVSYISSSDGFNTFSAAFVGSCTSPTTNIPYNPGNFEYIMRTNCQFGLNSSYAGPLSITTIDVEYLMVAGGGGGGYGGGGGGGAGGLLSGSTGLSSGNYPIFVGAGGAGGTGIQYTAGSASGSNTTFNGLTAIGGGGGSRGGIGGAFAGSGGSGGGEGLFNLAIGRGTGSGTPGQGFNGGAGSRETSPGELFGFAAGGGGGAGQLGGNAGYYAGGSQPLQPTGQSWGGSGGIGVTWLDGLEYAGGGSAGFTRYTECGAKSGEASHGGGEARQSFNASGSQAIQGTGGGGFGSANNDGFDGPTPGPGGTYTTGGNGASGIVKIRYAGSGSKATGGDIYYSGSYTYHKFTTSAGPNIEPVGFNGSGSSYTFTVF